MPPFLAFALHSGHRWGVANYMQAPLSVCVSAPPRTRLMLQKHPDTSQTMAQTIGRAFLSRVETYCAPRLYTACDDYDEQYDKPYRRPAQRMPSNSNKSAYRVSGGATHGLRRTSLSGYMSSGNDGCASHGGLLRLNTVSCQGKETKDTARKRSIPPPRVLPVEIALLIVH